MDLISTRAVELAQGMKAAHQNTQLIKGTSISRVSHDQKSTENSGKQEQSKKKSCTTALAKLGTVLQIVPLRTAIFTPVVKRAT